jgi:hypothetical protein
MTCKVFPPYHSDEKQNQAPSKMHSSLFHIPIRYDRATAKRDSLRAKQSGIKILRSARLDKILADAASILKNREAVMEFETGNDDATNEIVLWESHVADVDKQIAFNRTGL